jgi:hypothetical protein
MAGKTGRNAWANARGWFANGNRKIYATDLRVAKMIARLAVLPIMPFDSLRCKIGRGALADSRKEIFFGVFEGQTKRACLAFVNTTGTSRVRKVRGTGLKLFLLLLFAFEEITHSILLPSPTNDRGHAGAEPVPAHAGHLHPRGRAILS